MTNVGVAVCRRGRSRLARDLNGEGKDRVDNNDGARLINLDNGRRRYLT
jgi:hypothetical protein